MKNLTGYNVNCIRLFQQIKSVVVEVSNEVYAVNMWLSTPKYGSHFYLVQIARQHRRIHIINWK